MAAGGAPAPESLGDSASSLSEGDHEAMLKALDGLPWVFIITCDAHQQWACMDWPFRCLYLNSCHSSASPASTYCIQPCCWVVTVLGEPDS